MRRFKAFFVFLIIVFAGFMLITPNSVKEGIKTALLICYNVVIPTLYPFTFCVLFIMNAINTKKLAYFEKGTKFLFGINAEEFLIFTLSLIGGYPTGAKLIEKRFSNLKTDDKKPNLLLCYCVNAGPAFIVIAVGFGILKSKAIGWLLLLAHIISSIIIAMILRPFSAKQNTEKTPYVNTVSFSKNFVNSAADSASATLTICIFVVLFGGFNAFLEYFSAYMPFLKYITPLLEITSATANSRNVYHIAFLLGFGGVCVWCQISALIKSFNIYMPLFIISRTFHGLLSMAIMRLFLKIFKISIPTFSNVKSVIFDGVYKTSALSFSLFCLGLLFIISTTNKNAGKI